MNTNSFKVTGFMSEKRQHLKIVVEYENRQDTTVITDQDIFEGHYWNTIMINFKLYDINLYYGDKWCLATYPIDENNSAKYDLGESVELREEW